MFDWIMKGIGFESEEEDQEPQEKKPNKKKKHFWFGRKKNGNEDDLYQSKSLTEFDKDQYNAIKEQSTDNSVSSGYSSDYSSGGFSYGSSSYGAKNFVFYNPESYEDIKKLVEYLKQGEPAIVNLDKITDGDAQRILDFISGAACALGGKLQRITGNYFLVTPDGYNITKPSSQL